MRIVFAVHTYWPEGNGVQMVTQYLAEGLAVDNEVYVITEASDATGEGLHNQVNIRRVCVEGPNAWNLFCGDKEKYIALLRELSPDIFICVCTQSWQFDWLYGEIDKLPGKKILYTHGFSGLRPYAGVSHKGLARLIRVVRHNLLWEHYYKKHEKTIRGFDAVIHLAATSESIKYVSQQNIPNNIIVGNAVEDIFFDMPVCEKEENFEEIRPLRYVCVSNYTALKNQIEIIKAFYDAEDMSGELILIGSEETEYYHQLVNTKDALDVKKGPRKVSFKVGMSRQEISRCLSECDIFISTSLVEACSVVLLEAAAKGLAIVSTNVGNASLIPGVIVVNHVRELPYMMNDLHDDPQLRQHCGRTLRHYAEQNAMVSGKIAQLENIMSQLLDETKK